ncbi:MAG: DeoR/GlpR family DNA-binding transcription regulator [Anaerolineae bacterium]|jgi:DeoR family transcriptional regulator of aga operon/DeoR family fructose operon transcriptional repressor|nr:DeoR/GlpR family DNA-binding transcription regulator [Anaerolineae bacterium]
MEQIVFPEERRQAIVDLVQRHGRVEVAALSQRFDVTGATIRADLQLLADQGVLVRTHGGAIPVGAGLHELSLVKRRQQHGVQKARIARASSALIEDGEAVFIDSSSTALAVVEHVRQRRDLTVVTNSLVVAQELLGQPNVTVVMPGGTLHHDTVSLIDVGGLAVLQRYHIAKGFFGAHGLTPADGLTDVSESEARVKRALVEMCRQVIAVVDATKWGRTGVASFARVQDVHKVITDVDAPIEMVQSVRDLGVEVALV